jgi:predicted Zn-dependent protease
LIAKPPLSEWLQLMLSEIARKQDEAQQAGEELQRREQEQPAAPDLSSPQYLSKQS